MLSERLLIRVSLLVTLLGLAALVLVSLTAELPLEHLSAVAEEREGESVRVEGYVVATRSAAGGNVTILTLESALRRTAVVFRSVNVTEGAWIELTGNIEVYDGEPELVVERILRSGGGR